MALFKIAVSRAKTNLVEFEYLFKQMNLPNAVLVI